MTGLLNGGRLTKDQPKVIQIGFNKCGTQTLHHYFQSNGNNSVHWDEGRLARQVFSNLRDGKPLLTGYEQYDVFSDMEFISSDFAFEAYKLFPLLSEQYPDSVFILNTRARDNWIRSRLHHVKGEYAEQWKGVLNVSNEDDLIAFWEREWHSHHRRVRDYFAAGRFRFFEFDIERQGPCVISENIPEFGMDERLYVTKGQTNYNSSFARLRAAGFVEGNASGAGGLLK